MTTDKDNRNAVAATQPLATSQDRTRYHQRAVAILKGIAVNQSTITSADLAWAINYQRVTRSINDLLAELKDVFAASGWPPLTCLVVVRVTGQPSVLSGFTETWRHDQRRCWAWARQSSDDRQRLRGAGAWADVPETGEVS